MIVNGAEFLTISEMAKILKLKPNTIKQRLFQKGIKPVSKDAIYEMSALEAARDSKMGRPPKAKPE
jgi:predicted ArsR family transcriptional regulator